MVTFSSTSITPRGWDEFLDTKRFNLPTAANVVDRVHGNIDRFQGNYLAVVAFVLALASYVVPSTRSMHGAVIR